MDYLGVDSVVARGVSKAAAKEKGEVIVDVDWATVKGKNVHEGVKENGLIWENWEKPPATIVAEVEKEGPILEVRGATVTIGETKDCETREEGVKVTCCSDDCGPWLAAGSCELSLEIASVRCRLMGGEFPPPLPMTIVVRLF